MKTLINRIKSVLITNLEDLELNYFNLTFGLIFLFWSVILFLILPITLISSLFNN